MPSEKLKSPLCCSRRGCHERPAIIVTTRAEQRYGKRETQLQLDYCPKHVEEIRTRVRLAARKKTGYDRTQRIKRLKAHRGVSSLRRAVY